MNMLTEPINQSLRYRNRTYRLNCSYDNVLEVQRLYREKDLGDMDKAMKALEMLVCSRMKLKFLRPSWKLELLELIVKEHIELPKRPPVGRQKKTVDFEQDSDYIYASFMEAYGLDLVDCQGKLHWKKFMALFQGLPEKTKIKEVMRIRAMDMPEAGKHNQKEIQNIMELKSYYALPVEGGGGKQGLDSLFGALERMAT